ncbi:MAG: phosphoribosylformylglycinamidine synthase [Saprospiraceae bacterium]
MMHQVYNNLEQSSLHIDKKPEDIKYIHDLKEYNKSEGLALSDDEMEYLIDLSKKLGRDLTDSEVFGFSQINSEHCRHKIFNGEFIIDGKSQDLSLFQMIRNTSNKNKNKIVSAYSDNVAFIEGPKIKHFYPENPAEQSNYTEREINSIISLKAETHNFPTTVEPFNGAATGSGGEIRDRMAGGKGSFPLTGSAIYMTSFPRLKPGRTWEQHSEPRKWIYHNPAEILIKASNGASDFGNKFGQPLTCGSLLTFEFFDNNVSYAYDKVIMLAGGVGFAKSEDSEKDIPSTKDIVVVMGGDNYRIGMGGGAVSSLDTGELSNSLELNAVQRSNPEMQKRVYNVIRALAESNENTIISIHDHGAGGHLNSLSELIEQTGGIIEIQKLPIGDPTLSYKELLSNESQERMGLVIDEKNFDNLQKISERERAPIYNVGEVNDTKILKYENTSTGETAFKLDIYDLFGKPPKSVLIGKKTENVFQSPEYDIKKLKDYTKSVLQIESVACKDWLTNKVDRSVTGRVAMQQNAGILHLPLNNLSVTALDFEGEKGIANALGHSSLIAVKDPVKSVRNALVKSLTNIIWAPIEDGLKGISLSANWMWPAGSENENARLYEAVKALSEFAIELGINIPTGKDSLSMSQKYSDGKSIPAPETVIISAVGEVSDITKSIEPVLQPVENTKLLFIDFSSDDASIDFSAFTTIFGKPGNNPPDITSVKHIINTFNIIQSLINENLILSGHDIGYGGKITSLLEMTFSSDDFSLDVDISDINDAVKYLFSENPGIFIQVRDFEKTSTILNENNIEFKEIGTVVKSDSLDIKTNNGNFSFNIEEYRDIWFESSYLLDKMQTKPELAEARFKNYKNQKLNFIFPNAYQNNKIDFSKRTINAAVIREKGINGDREMAYALYAAGFNVVDVHMTDLVSGRENLENIDMLVFPGGFSNSDVLGSAKGWAGAFKYNEKAKQSIENFYKRQNTMSLGVCNGCQLMMELNLIYPEMDKDPKMKHNDSGKFESSFLTVDILPSESIMLKSLENSKLGVWVAHGEGKFDFPTNNEKDYNISMKYHYEQYPGNPNGSQFNTAAVCSKDGRHLAMMPHLERSLFMWHWPYKTEEQKQNHFSPWIEAFVNARKWLEGKKS